MADARIPISEKLIQRRSFFGVVIAAMAGALTASRIIPHAIRNRLTGAGETPQIRAVPHPMAVPRNIETSSTNE